MTINPLHTLRQLTFSRGAARLWHDWKAAGLPLLALYWLGIGFVVLASLREAYFSASFTLPGWSLGVGVSGLWLAAALVRRQPVWLHTTDDLLLQTPLPQAQALRWPLLRSSLGPLAWGVCSGLLIVLLFPGLIWQAATFPVAFATAAMIRALSVNARLADDAQARAFALWLALLPLLGAFFAPSVLPLAAVGIWAAYRAWLRLWQVAIHPRPRLHMQFEGLCRGAQKLGLPAPTQHPDLPPAHSRFRPVLRGSGVFAASAWRSTLHVLTHARLLLPALLLGPALLPLLSPVPFPGGPVYSGLLLMLMLPLLGPNPPAGLPITAAAQRWTRILPAAVPLSVLALVSGVATVLFVQTSPLLVLVAVLAPWVVLAVSEWLATSGFMLPDQIALARFGAAMLPGIVTYLCISFGLAWLTLPALVLAALIVFRR
ncbi:hypothetical protein [Deinococcus puniceus]|uniref:Uncharacterized protein n=1 Tax=Deinococcus puniceus TaxID=1182568 RepID=A0A172T5V2_9DEIO|nr:hypothetical protein [Deinococcus puniceus]ANE42409.1 hypothetical protein SU48_00020 [Deinococcus puniceus]